MSLVVICFGCGFIISSVDRFASYGVVNFPGIVPSHRSHDASDKYPKMHHFVAEMCTHVHISVTKCFIAGYVTDALWDLWDCSILRQSYGCSSFRQGILMDHWKKCLHFHEIFITSTGRCENYNFQCWQCWTFRQNDDIFVSVYG